MKAFCNSFRKRLLIPFFPIALSVWLSGVACEPGTQGDAFAVDFPTGKYDKSYEHGIRTGDLEDGFFERGMSADKRYHFLRSWVKNGELELIECLDTERKIQYTLHCQWGHLRSRRYVNSESNELLLREVTHYSGTDDKNSRTFCNQGQCSNWPLPMPRAEICVEMAPLHVEVSESFCDGLGEARD